jgi:hypothetical protein
MFQACEECKQTFGEVEVSLWVEFKKTPELLEMREKKKSITLNSFTEA